MRTRPKDVSLLYSERLRAHQTTAPTNEMEETDRETHGVVTRADFYGQRVPLVVTDPPAAAVPLGRVLGGRIEAIRARAVARLYDQGVSREPRDTRDSEGDRR